MSEIPEKKLADILNHDIYQLKKIIESIEAFDNGDWVSWSHVSEVLRFLGASTVDDNEIERGYEGEGIESGFLHPDEVFVATCSYLIKKGKLSSRDIPSTRKRSSAFEIMENAKKGYEIKVWQEEGLPSGMGYYPRHKRITETIFGLYKVQCLWQKDDGPWQIGGDHEFKECGYRILMA